MHGSIFTVTAGKQRRRLCIIIIVLTLVVALPVALVRSELRQEQIDRELVVKACAGDAVQTEQLLARGANANATITAPLPGGLWRYVQHLLPFTSRGGNPGTDRGDPVLALVIQHLVLETRVRGANAPQHDRIVVALLRHGADCSSVSALLEIAARLGLDATARDMISRGADVNVTSPIRQTPIMRADPELAVTLLKHGANPNAKDLRGWTALMYACEEYSDTTKPGALLAAGADPNILNEDGLAALAMAETPGDVRLLIEHGAHINARDNSGETALRHAERESAGPRFSPGHHSRYKAIAAVLKASGAAE